MSSKELAIESIKTLPEEATWEDIKEKINFVAGVRKGLRQLNEGKGIPHEEIKKEIKAWASR